MKKNEMTKKLMEEFNEDFIDVGGVLDTTLPDPTMVEYYRRLKKREILWNDDISDATIDIALYIKKWNAEDKGIAPEERKPIKIFINSDGGSVDTVLHIIDMIHLSKTPIYTIGMGRVYSAMSFLIPVVSFMMDLPVRSEASAKCWTTWSLPRNWKNA